ncbi:hypothetical protein [Sphingomonas sp.]|uniref:hypothetical protein n=1 Tax=Sphingomonas sp. TaxID=28214 RepID=UPI0025F4879F|nr:hypothetical protein [Sphingomonas sp.]
MPSVDIDRCLLLLREAELLLLRNGESVLASQVSIVTGRLMLRYPRDNQPTH